MELKGSQTEKNLLEAPLLLQIIYQIFVRMSIYLQY